MIWILALLLSIPNQAIAEDITLQWDPVDTAQGYRLFQAIRGGNPVSHTFDYSAPVASVGPEVTKVTVSLPGTPGIDVKYVFVARAYRGDTESDDSNLVSYVVCLVPPPTPINLAYAAGRFTWEQPPDDYPWRKTDHWVLYNNGVEIDRVEVESINRPMEGGLYTVRAWRSSGVSSEPSNTIGLPAVREFKIE